MSAKTKDILIRAVKTFVQAFAAALVVPIAAGWNVTEWKSAVIGAAAAAISALMNYIKYAVHPED